VYSPGSDIFTYNFGFANTDLKIKMSPEIQIPAATKEISIESQKSLKNASHSRKLFFDIHSL
jgi:hypothetical protein